MLEPPALEVRGLLIGDLRVNLAVRRGECLIIQGASGSGKTRLLRAIADLDPALGEISLSGVPREAVPAPQWRRQVCYVSAEPGWWCDTVAPHFPTWPLLLPLLAALGLSANHGLRTVASLSTGERQRLALLRALVLDPQVLLLDEPTSALDPAATQAVEEVLQHRMQNGQAILLATHNFAQAKRLGRQTLFLGAAAPGVWWR
jgi:phosphate-transporting ATPase